VALFLVACVLGVEAGEVCWGEGLVSPGQAISTILNLPLVFAIFGQPFALAAYPVLVLVLVVLLFSDLPWTKVLAVVAMPFFLLWFGMHVFLLHCRM
jgi:hypothetical protein